MQNHENEHVHDIRLGEARLENTRIRGLNLAVVKLTVAQVTKMRL
jgi:hypothetical protein